MGSKERFVERYVRRRAGELRHEISFYEALQTPERLARGLCSRLLIADAKRKFEALKVYARENGVSDSYFEVCK